jgi:hypothetical protein
MAYWQPVRFPKRTQSRETQQAVGAEPKRGAWAARRAELVPDGAVERLAGPDRLDTRDQIHVSGHNIGHIVIDVSLEVPGFLGGHIAGIDQRATLDRLAAGEAVGEQQRVMRGETALRVVGPMVLVMADESDGRLELDVDPGQFALEGEVGSGGLVR